MGSCVDNTRAAQVAVAVANKLGVDLDKLPVVASAPEATTEKAIAIGTWAGPRAAHHVGVIPPVQGSPLVAKVLTRILRACSAAISSWTPTGDLGTKTGRGHPGEKGRAGAMKEIFVRLDRCQGCRSCQLACAVAHSQSKTLFGAVAKPQPRLPHLY